MRSGCGGRPGPSRGDYPVGPEQDFPGPPDCGRDVIRTSAGLLDDPVGPGVGHMQDVGVDFIERRDILIPFLVLPADTEAQPPIQSIVCAGEWSSRDRVSKLTPPG